MLNIKLLICLLVAFIIGFSNSLSQEALLYRNSYIDPFIANPATTGMHDYPLAHLSLNRQWIGFPGSPFTFSLTGNSKLGRFGFYDPQGFVNKGPLKLKERIGLGAALYYDKNGPLTNTGSFLSYGYHIALKNFSHISFGMSLLITEYSLNSSTLDPDQVNDVFLYSGNDDVIKTNFGFGVFYYAKQYFGGISVNKILPGITNVSESPKINPRYFALAGLKIGNINHLYSFEPSLEIKNLVSREFIVDVHAKIYYKRLNWGALSFNTSRQMSVQFALRIYKMVYAGYNYGYTFNRIESINNGTHMISIGINLGLFGVEGIRKTI